MGLANAAQGLLIVEENLAVSASVEGNKVPAKGRGHENAARSAVGQRGAASAYIEGNAPSLYPTCSRAAYSRVGSSAPWCLPPKQKQLHAPQLVLARRSHCI